MLKHFLSLQLFHINKSLTESIYELEEKISPLDRKNYKLPGDSILQSSRTLDTKLRNLDF